jgi:hypothetical protein
MGRWRLKGQRLFLFWGPGQTPGPWATRIAPGNE